MSDLIYDPSVSSPMNVAVFLSGSGTNFEALYNEQKRLESLGSQRYGRIGFVFTDVPECRGADTARRLGIPTKVIDAKLFNQKLGVNKTLSIDSPARVGFDALSIYLMEQVRQPDLICLAGYERWLSPYFVERYGNKILNVHPGDTSKGYIGLGEKAVADAILAGEETTRSTIFFVDQSKDMGPVLVQSHPIPVFTQDNKNDLDHALKYAHNNRLINVREFQRASKEDEEANRWLQTLLKLSKEVQGRMKERGDWPSYKFAVHYLIAQGRVAINDKNVFVDGVELPPHGFRLDEHQDEFQRSGIEI